MNKKLISLILVGILGFGVVGCSSEEVVKQENVQITQQEDKAEDVEIFVKDVVQSTMGNNYEVEVMKVDDYVYVDIIINDTDISRFTENQLKKAIKQLNIDTSQDSLAKSIKDIYEGNGYDVTVKVSSYDLNGQNIYTTFK